MSQNSENFDLHLNIFVLALSPTHKTIPRAVNPLSVSKKKGKTSYLLNKLKFTNHLGRVNGAKSVMRRKGSNIFKAITL